MPRPPQVSPVTGNPVPDHYIHASDVHFRDTQGRVVLLRGVNISGAAKNPAGMPSWEQKGFWENAEAGTTEWRNCNLNIDDGTADVHLARLKAWGFNMLRYVYTWEGLEHKGPGVYDYEYMDYVVQVLRKCKEYGFRVNMDPHQDVWSRFTGGSGAPLWTIYACGVDPHAIVDTYSALVHSDYPRREKPDPQSLPCMIWASNYYRPFGHTVWTLFFAGKEFAPKCVIDGKNIQDFLQDHFIDACSELVKHVAKAGDLLDSVVIGWDSINEPAEGMIGIKDISIVPADQPVRLGPTATPFQNMRLAMGHPVEVDNYIFTSLGPKKTGRVILDPKGKKMWLSESADAQRGAGRWGWKRGEEWKVGTCIWAQHGVWDTVTSKLLQPAYFARFPTNPAREVEFVDDFWRLHWMSFASAMRKHHPEAIHFMATTVFKPLPNLPESFLAHRACATPHYYDGLTLMTRHWNWFNADALGVLRGKYWSVAGALRVGESAIRKSFQSQLGVLKQDTLTSLGNYPTMIGEIGCPFDMDGRKAYGYVEGGKGKGDYTAQRKAWDASVNAHDGPNSLNFTLWTYVPNNSHMWGDDWNGEDLSLWSADDSMKAIDSDNLRSSGSSTEDLPPTTGLLSSMSVSSSRTLLPLPRVSPMGIDAGTEVTPQLILDGARAVSAFCRPYPVFTVGEPVRIDFDIASSKFHLQVTVRPDDLAGETEIYLPFVHYASNLEWDKFDQTASFDDERPKSNTLELDIDVVASVGTWSTSGQYLQWTYPIPLAPTTYTMEIRRRGGALPLHCPEPKSSLAEFFGCTFL